MRKILQKSLLGLYFLMTLGSVSVVNAAEPEPKCGRGMHYDWLTKRCEALDPPPPVETPPPRTPPKPQPPKQNNK